MAKRKILSYDKAELKAKLNRFYYSVGGFFGGYDTIEIKRTDTITSTFTHSGGGNMPTPKIVAIESDQWNSFIDELFNFEILNWKLHYYDNQVCDGEQWELELDFDGIPNFTSDGSNRYPYNWEKFGKIMKKYFKMNAGGIDDFIEEQPASKK
jgi:hypothetical protein